MNCRFIRSNSKCRTKHCEKTRLELSESHDRYVDLYDFAPVGYVSLNADGKVLESNLTAAALLGVSREQLQQQQNINRFFADRFLADVAWRHRREVLEADHRLACEVGMKSSNGVPLTVRWESVAAGTEPRRICRIAMIDLTTFKHVQQLQESEARYRTLNATFEQRVDHKLGKFNCWPKPSSSLGEGVMITGNMLGWPNPKIVYVNKAMLDITGYTAEEMLDNSPRMLQGERSDKSVLGKLRQELSACRSHRCEVVNYRKDGTTYDAEVFVSPMNDADGKNTNFIGIHRDITARKQVERALRDTEEMFLLFTNNSPAMAWIKDEQGRYVYQSDSFVEWFGDRTDDYRGKTDHEMLPVDIADEFRRNDVKAMHSGQTQEVIEEAVGAEGQTETWWNFKFPFTNLAGEKFIGGMGMDITKRLQAEAGLRDRRRDGFAMKKTSTAMASQGIEVRMRRTCADGRTTGGGTQACVEAIEGGGWTASGGSRSSGPLFGSARTCQSRVFAVRHQMHFSWRRNHRRV